MRDHRSLDSTGGHLPVEVDRVVNAAYKRDVVRERGEGEGVFGLEAGGVGHCWSGGKGMLGKKALLMRSLHVEDVVYGS